MFETPLGLLCLLGIPYIVWLHTFRKKPQRRKVSAIFLWQSVGHIRTDGRQKQPFQQNLSFWLEILGTILLSLLLAQPKACRKTAEHLVFIIDTSASMHTESIEKSIQQDMQNILKRSSSNSLITVISAGRKPQILVGPQAELYKFQSIDINSFMETSSDIPSAIQLAENITLGNIHVWSDDIPNTEISDLVEWHAVGTPHNNVGIVWTELQDKTIDIHLQNASTLSTAVTLNLYEKKRDPKTDNQPIHTEQITVSPTELKKISLSIQHPHDSIFHVEIIPDTTLQDGLDIDNHSYVLEKAKQTITIAVDMPSAEALQLGLASNSGDIPIVRLDKDTRMGSPLEADILFTNRNIGGSPTTWRVSFFWDSNPPQIAHTSFFVDTANPILYNVQLSDIVWAFSPDKVMQGTPLIQDGIALLTEEKQNQGQRRVYSLNYNPNYSNWHKHHSWPIFLHNLLQKRRENLGGLENNSLRLTEDIHIIDAQTGEWTITTPSGTVYQHTVQSIDKNTSDIFYPCTEIGTYSFTHLDGTTYNVVCNLHSPEESSLQNKQSNFIPAQQEKAEEVFTPDSRLLQILLVVAMIIWLYDWEITKPQPSARYGSK